MALEARQRETQLWAELNSAFKRTDLAAAVVGALAGAKYGVETLHWLSRQPEAYSELIGGYGPHVLNGLAVANIAAGSMIAWASCRIASNMLRYYAASRGDIEQGIFAGGGYVLPPWPLATPGKFRLVLGEVHGGEVNKARYIAEPTWYTIPEAGLFGNIGVFGGIGSGKTAAAAYAAVRQLFEMAPRDADLKPGGLILDVKGDFVHKVAEIAAEYGRVNDLMRIKPGGEHTWNPIHSPDLPPEAIASRLIAVYENLTGGAGQDGNWVTDGAMKLMAHTIGMLRQVDGYVTLASMNALVSRLGGEKQYVDGDEINPLDEVLRPYKHRWQEIIDTAETTELQREEWDYHMAYFEGEWANDSGKNKAVYMGAVTSVTGTFSKPEMRSTFSPDEGNITFPGFDALIDSGTIVAIDAPESKYGNLSSVLGILLKLEFQRSALSRVSRAKDKPDTNTKRLLFFMCDEYQNFVTTTSIRSKDGDDNFYALSRQSRCVSLVMTQAFVSLAAKIGEEKMRVILASIRTKIFLALVDEKDQKAASEICGKAWRDIENHSFNENLENAEWNPMLDEFTGKKSSVSEAVSMNRQYISIVEETTFSRLRTFESIVFAFDGIKQREPERVYLKTDFVPAKFADKYTARSLPFKQLIDYMEQENEA